MISNIIAGIKAQIGTTLPTYTEAPFIFQPNKNQLGTLENAFIVRALGGDQTVGAVKSLTMTREFSVTLLQEYYGNQLNDVVIADAEVAMLEQVEELYGAIAQTKLGSDRVLNVHSMVSEDPEVNYENKYIQVNITFSVQYFRRI